VLRNLLLILLQLEASPFFQENKEQLIQAVNNWLAPENSSAGFFWL